MAGGGGAGSGKAGGKQGTGGGGAESGGKKGKQISVRVTWEEPKMKQLYGQVYQLVKQEGDSVTLKKIGGSGIVSNSYEIPLSTS